VTPGVIVPILAVAVEECAIQCRLVELFGKGMVLVVAVFELFGMLVFA
jgi:hypothetical protein